MQFGELLVRESRPKITIVRLDDGECLLAQLITNGVAGHPRRLEASPAAPQSR